MYMYLPIVNMIQGRPLQLLVSQLFWPDLQSLNHAIKNYPIITVLSCPCDNFQAQSSLK